MTTAMLLSNMESFENLIAHYEYFEAAGRYGRAFVKNDVVTADYRIVVGTGPCVTSGLTMRLTLSNTDVTKVMPTTQRHSRSDNPMARPTVLAVSIVKQHGQEHT